MKTRKGLVSNSSSSSFIIAYPKEMTRTKMLERLGISKDSPLIDLVGLVIDVLLCGEEYTEEKFLKNFDYDSWEEWEEDYGLEQEEEAAKIAFKKGWIIRYDFASDEDGPGETALCEATIHYDSKDLVIHTKGGY